MLNERPLVSIISVTYNSSAFVRDTIESVLAQSHSQFEYIIADDCSSDGTWEIIAQYDDPRIRAIRNASNLGEYRNRNQALELSEGAYVIFIDGDDIIYPHGLEIYLRYALQYPEAAMVVQKAEINNAIFPLLMKPKDIVLNYFNGPNLLTSSFGSNFFKSSVLKSIGLPLEFIQGDEYTRFKIAARHPVLVIPGSMTWIRETPGQASSKLGSYKGYQDSCNIFQALSHDFSDLGADCYAFIARKLFAARRVELKYFLTHLRWKSAALAFREAIHYNRKCVKNSTAIFTDISDFSPTYPLKQSDQHVTSTNPETTGEEHSL